MPADADVIIIGAGLSGLLCATRLAAGGARVRVLEARDRVGGRLLGRGVGGARFDLGGQWWTRGQTRLAALADELAVPRVPQYRTGSSVVALASPPRSLPGRIFDALARGRRLAALSRMIARAGHDAPRAWDHESLGAWLARELPDAQLREHVLIHCEMTFATDPHELSLLDYLAQLAAGGDPFDGSAGDEHRFVPGAFALPARLAAALGDRVSLATPVRAIDADAATVTTDAGTLRASHVVLALPPSAARAIAFTPPLHPGAAAALTATRAGPVVKLVATYDRPFWRDTGLSGEAYLKPGLVRATVDACSDVPALAVFVVASDAAAWTPAHLPRAIDDLARLFGDAAASPTDIAFHDWGADPFAHGCVAGLPPGARSAGAAWRGPHGRLHIAGTEAASRWPGFMEGAIDAAERAADAILAARTA
ncbi:MAG TPA: FAD-dependent oxidoreductase [Kofleriaceae bacterium]|nr:FAD-dependent oxidoreductase [Kofleriaceae bacterium]